MSEDFLQETPDFNEVPKQEPLWLKFILCPSVILLTGMAAGLGWGIRGQYGHETGAMIAGVLASLTLVMFFLPYVSAVKAARTAAMMAVAIGIGGSMTYGQTVGLTHDKELIGNHSAYTWGMVGLFIKGALWIGFGGLFLGMGLSGKKYRPTEVFLMMLGMIGLWFVGVWLLNLPFDPANKKLPMIYFSDDWRFEPDGNLKPRREIWGGYLFALAGAITYLKFVRKDSLAIRLALIGMLAGGLGFCGGQAIQAYRAWNPEVFTEGWLSDYKEIFNHFNWWNMMETTFGFIWGFVLALGVWLNRHLISLDSEEAEKTIPVPVEFLVVGIHLTLVMVTEFLSMPEGWEFLDIYIDYGLVLVTLPLMMIVNGRVWPYLMLLFVSLVPICGKTIRQLSFKSDQFSEVAGWVLLVGLPLSIALAVVSMLIAKSFKKQEGRDFSATALITMTLIFFSLNTAFFEFAWPWNKDWTGRTPNQTIFMLFAFFLVFAGGMRLVIRRSPG